MLHTTLALATLLVLALSFARGAVAQPAPAGGPVGATPAETPSAVQAEALPEKPPAEAVPAVPPTPEKKTPRGPSPQELSSQMRAPLRGLGDATGAKPLKQAESESAEAPKVGPFVVGGTLAAEEARAARDNADKVLRRQDSGKQETYLGIATGKGKEEEKDDGNPQEGGRGRLEGIDLNLDPDNAKIKWIFKF